MPLSEIFEQQREIEGAQSRAGENSITMLCLDTGSSRIAIALESAREVVEHPHIVGYPIAVKPHVGLANVRGSVVPVVSLGTGECKLNTMIVLESAGKQPFALLARDVRPVILKDSNITANSRSTSPTSGVVSIDGRPIRWCSVAWLVQRLFGGNDSVSR